MAPSNHKAPALALPPRPLSTATPASSSLSQLEELRAWMSAYGEVLDISRHGSFAFVQYATVEEGIAAIMREVGRPMGAGKTLEVKLVSSAHAVRSWPAGHFCWRWATARAAHGRACAPTGQLQCGRILIQARGLLPTLQ
jgi:hypothetical protein